MKLLDALMADLEHWLLFQYITWSVFDFLNWEIHEMIDAFSFSELNEYS